MPGIPSHGLNPDTARLTIGMRGDLYGYDVRAQTLAANSGKGSNAMVNPKGG